MSEITIKCEPLIFDDPEYCGKNKEECGYMNDNDCYVVCYLFPSKHDVCTKLIFDSNVGQNLKCPECKFHWKLADQARNYIASANVTTKGQNKK